MTRDVQATYIHPDNSRDRTFSLTIPKSCPCCGVAYDRVPLRSYFNGADKRFGEIFSLYGCPSCDNFFVVRYSWNRDCGNTTISLISEYPKRTQQTQFSDDIRNLSPRFVKIFQQAEQAEQYELSEICGMGYRKSLEFLVKDYTIHLQPESETTIKETLLVKCIDTYIQNDKIKTLAKASAWLGNDETHYVRKHEDYSVEHLKTFINTLVAFIEFNLSAERAENLINSQKKPHS